MQGHAAPVCALAVGPASPLLASAEEGSSALIRLWRLEDGACLSLLHGERLGGMHVHSTVDAEFLQQYWGRSDLVLGRAVSTFCIVSFWWAESSVACLRLSMAALAVQQQLMESTYKIWRTSCCSDMDLAASFLRSAHITAGQGFATPRMEALR